MKADSTDTDYSAMWNEIDLLSCKSAPAGERKLNCTVTDYISAPAGREMEVNGTVTDCKSAPAGGTESKNKNIFIRFDQNSISP